MANREKGEVGVEVEGKSYLLRPTVNALCELEDLTGKTVAELATRASAGSVRAARDLLWAYLQEAHRDEFKTPKDVGVWIERAGGLDRVMKALTDVIAVNAAETSAGESADPPAAQASTGAPST